MWVGVYGEHNVYVSIMCEKGSDHGRREGIRGEKWREIWERSLSEREMRK